MKLLFLLLFLALVASFCVVSEQYATVGFRRRTCIVNGAPVLEMGESPVVMTPTTEAASCCYRTQFVPSKCLTSATVDYY